MINLIVLIILAFVAAIDLWLIFTKRPTISQAYQRLAPTWWDMCLMAILTLAIIYSPLDPAIKVLLGVIAGHIAWPNKERYG